MIAVLQAIVGIAVLGGFIGFICTIIGCVQSLRGDVVQIEKMVARPHAS
jgi:hypothetical protein